MTKPILHLTKKDIRGFMNEASGLSDSGLEMVLSHLKRLKNHKQFGKIRLMILENAANERAWQDKNGGRK
jgi:hypothetical protein